MDSSGNGVAIQRTVILVEDNPDHAALISRYLSKAKNEALTLEHLTTLQAAISRLELGGVDAMLLDLSLTDSLITETLPAVLKKAPTVPIIVLTSMNDLEFATKAVHQGAQDYLVKSDISSESLVRAINYAIERKHQALALERSNAELRRFAGTIAHEIRSPMAAVHSCLQILLRRYREQFDEKTLGLIDKTVGRTNDLSDLVHDLLNFAQTEPESVLTYFDTRQVCEEAVDLLNPEILRTRAQVTYEALPTIKADKRLLRQVFHNLIGNALKYCDVQPRIVISCEDRGSEWVFTVRDNGLGIPAGQEHGVFDMFKRVHDRNDIPGTGIGLAFCKRAIEHLNGMIWVKSTLGQGSEFYFSIPKQTEAGAVSGPDSSL